MASVNNKRLAFVNILVFITVIVINYLAVSLPLNNKTTGQLSDEYPNLFTPAGITFSIWGVIYLFLTLFIIYQAIVLFKNESDAIVLKKITPFFIINCLANAAWLFAWHYQQVALSVVIMLVMLFTLITIHNKLKLALPWRHLKQKFLLDVPFSLYLGWISIATIANITVLFVVNNIVPFGLSQSVWTIIMIAIATLLTLIVLWRKSNIVFALVVCWALYGIIAKRSAAGDAGQIITACYAALAIIAIVILLTLFIKKKKALYY